MKYVAMDLYGFRVPEWVFDKKVRQALYKEGYLKRVRSDRKGYIRRKCKLCGAKHSYYHGQIGYCRKRLLEAYRNMKKRCYNPKTNKYEYYGGRGIQVCPEWKDNWKIFEMWAVRNGYGDNLTMDRINNDSNYKPDNCRWIPWLENNKRRKGKKYKKAVEK